MWRWVLHLARVIDRTLTESVFAGHDRDGRGLRAAGRILVNVRCEAKSDDGRILTGFCQ